MKSTIKKLLGAAITAASLLVASNAAADGLVLEPADLPSAERDALQDAIAQAKADDPEAFEMLHNIKGHLPETYKKFRNPIPLVGREIRAIGPRAVMPVIEALAFDMWDVPGATEAELNALKYGMLDALGRWRSHDSAAVLQTAFAIDNNPVVLQASANSLGKLCDDGSLSILETALGNSERRLAALSGLGHCRRPAAASLLTDALDHASNNQERQVIGKALGYVGSSWAWEAMARNENDAKAAASVRKLGLEVRRMASAALVRSFVNSKGAARDAQRVGLTMCAHPEIRSIAAKNRAGADEATNRALDGVIAQIESRK